ncbi:MAG: CotH kinase family protein [Bacteroidales bacterium]|nr:CotH kinase family protein [Bacteroidales bacterium]MCF8403709.1 CotH kinase family protein [Bacteroidales bacterium]
MKKLIFRLYRICIFLGFLGGSFGQLYSQIVINEICSRNNSVLLDDDHESNDWVELFNTSDDTINLADWYISDVLGNTTKWQFPEIKVLPDSFLIIIAGDNSKKEVVDHWETVIQAEDIWKYWIPDSNPDSLWNTLSFNDSSWMEGPGGFGRGDGDDNTVLPDSVATVYIRKTFTIPDTSILSNALLHIDYDDAFVAYLNGVEIARANIGWPGKIQSWDDIAYGIHRAVMLDSLLPDEFKIEPEVFKSIIKEGENLLAIQGLNAWNNHGNSSLIPFLSVSVKDTSQYFDDVPWWFGKKPVYLHCNFKLSGDGESVILSDTEENIIDIFNFPYTNSDHSYGRETDGSAEMAYFNAPTPGYSNGFSTPFFGYTKTPLLNKAAGFYSESFELEVLNLVPGDSLRYTLDGSQVTDSSALFTEGILIDSTQVVKTRYFKSGLLPGKTNTKSFIFNYVSTLPLISLSINPHDLWDWEEGIYVLGPNADPGFPFLGANFWQDWAKPIHIEYFDTTQNLAFDLDADVEIHGGFSRAYDQKSLRVICSNKYDTPEINYKIFGQKDISNFKKLVLRNSGQDFNQAHFRDAFMHDLLSQNPNINYQAYEPSIVFLNGEYWGIHNIREKIDRYYLNSNFSVHTDSVDLLRDNRIIMEGDYYSYEPMIEYIKAVTLADSIVYDSVSKLVDIENYTDYFIAEMFYVNHDWPGHNTKYWRERKEGSKWRYILTDVDFGFGSISNVSDNELYRVLHNNIQWADNHWILRKLITNMDYQEYFINRSADMFNTYFRTDIMVNKIMEFKERLAPEMPMHKARWGGTFEAWEAQVNGMVYFAENRIQFVHQHYINEFGLEKTVEVSISVDSTAHGNIHINTLSPDTFPWQGTYFDGNPITLIAKADSGYIFSHWESSLNLSAIDSASAHLRINVDTNAFFIAHYFPDTFNTFIDTPFVIINEINYHSNDTLDAGDWIEIFNPDTVSWDLTGWVFKDGNDDHQFIIPDSLILDTSQYLVLYRDSIKFKVIFPEVTNAIGPFEFGLANEGENLRLFDSTGFLVYNVPYSNLPPWPNDADSTGKTINITNAIADPTNGLNWFSACIGGSPGGPTLPCDTVGVPDRFITNFEIWFYPNPVTGNININLLSDMSEVVNIRIYDVFGNTVLQRKATVKAKTAQHLIYPIDSMDDGLYFINFFSGNLNNTYKILIQK